MVGAYKTVKGRMSAVVDSIMLASDGEFFSWDYVNSKT